MSDNAKHGGAREGAGRPRSEPTKMVRVPVGCLDDVKELIARYKASDDDGQLDWVGAKND